MIYCSDNWHELLTSTKSTPDIECILACIGSGAAQASTINHRTICNIDIGFEIASIAIACNGDIRSIASIPLGSGCLRFQSDGVILHISDSAELFMDATRNLKPCGASSTAGEREHWGNLISELLIQYVISPRPPQLAERLALDNSLTRPFSVDDFWFSGSAAELMDGTFAKVSVLDDMGPYLAKGLVASMSQRRLSYTIARNAARAIEIGKALCAFEES